MTYLSIYRRFRRVVGASSLAVLFSFPLAAQATTLSSVGDAVFGTNSVTRDSASGLEWLDLTESTNRSVFDLKGFDGTNEFIAGGDFVSWRYATATEVHTLFVNAMVPSVPAFFNTIEDDINLVSLGALQTLIGCTRDCGGVSARNYSYGLLPSTRIDIPSTSLMYFLLAGDSASQAQINFDWALDPVFVLTEAEAELGNWLVRSTTVVPLPAALPLFGTGLGILGFLGWRRRRKTAAAV